MIRVLGWWGGGGGGGGLLEGEGERMWEERMRMKVCECGHVG